MVHCIPKDGNAVMGISVHPRSLKGEEYILLHVFGAGSIDDGVLRIFDIRFSTIGIANAV